MELPELPDLPVWHPEYKRAQHERNRFFRDLLDRIPVSEPASRPQPEQPHSPRT